MQLSRISITDAFNRDQNTQINQITFSPMKIISCRIKLVYSGGLGIQLSRLLTLSHKFQRFLGSISEAFHVDELWHSFTKLFLRRDKILLYRRHLAISSLGIFSLSQLGYASRTQGCIYPNFLEDRFYSTGWSVMLKLIT